MEFTGKLVNVTRDWKSGELHITFSINEESAVNEIENIQGFEKLRIEAKEYKKKRSADANKMMWACIGDIAAKLRADKWDIYLLMLKRYGKFTYICVKPNVVNAVKEQWRESEVIGEMEINGQPAVQMLCYFGSSLYNTQEFSVLLDGIIAEMKELGLETPMSEDMRRALEQWEKMKGGAA